MDSKKPVFKRPDHVSLTVADLDAAIQFYTEVMNAELAYRMGPFDSSEIPAEQDGRDWSDAHINVKGARLEIAMLRLGDNFGMELFQYERPDDANQTPPRNCDVGSRHLCIEVDNVQLAITFLEENGCKAMSGPISMENGPGPASHSWYVLDPFGNQLELVEYINGK